jgi:hypothetical protein
MDSVWSADLQQGERTVANRVSYKERMGALLREAQSGSRKAMQELHRRYHINKMMIEGRLVDLAGEEAEGIGRAGVQSSKNAEGGI